MPLDTTRGPSMGVQDADPHQLHRAYEEIHRQNYPGDEKFVGSELWSEDNLSTEGLHNEILYHTGLLGTGTFLGRSLRTMPPMSTYKTVDQVVADYKIFGSGFEYYPDEIDDMLYKDVVLSKVKEVPSLLRDIEEDEHFDLINNGETKTSGWDGGNLFTSTLHIIGEGTSVSKGSNIITTAGGPGFHMASLADQYGDNFLNEEGRPAPLSLVMILCGPQNGRLLEFFYGAPGNVDQTDPRIPNPVRSNPRIVTTNRLANANNMYLFYEGFQEDLKFRAKFRNKSLTETVGSLTTKRVVTISRSRVAHYWRFNRRVVLVTGGA